MKRSAQIQWIVCLLLGCGKLGIDSSSAKRDIAEIESANHDAFPEGTDTDGDGRRKSGRE